MSDVEQHPDALWCVAKLLYLSDEEKTLAQYARPNIHPKKSPRNVTSYQAISAQRSWQMITNWLDGAMPKVRNRSLQFNRLGDETQRLSQQR